MNCEILMFEIRNNYEVKTNIDRQRQKKGKYK